MAWLELPHPDQITGALGELLQFVAHPVANTLDDLDLYRGCGPEVLFPAPDRRPDLSVRSRWRLPGLIGEDLRFESLHQPLEPNFRRRYARDYRATHQVYARRIRPSGAGQRPRLLYVHGYMQPETYFEEFSLLTSLALLLNVEVIQIQPAYHGRRAPQASRFSGELFWTADLVRSVEALRQTLLDARTLLDLLLADDDRPVGVAGLSLGGSLTLTLTCLEPRFAFSVPMIAHMDLKSLVADAPVLGRMRRDLDSFGWDIEDFGDFVDDLGWNRLTPQLAPERVFLVAASQDRFFDPRIVEATRQRWGEPAIQWYATSHMGFIARLPDAIARTRRFIDGLSDLGDG